MPLVRFKRHRTKSYVRYRIRSPRLFKKSSFRTLDVGRRGHHQLIRARLKSTGKYATQAVIVEKGTKPSRQILKKARLY